MIILGTKILFLFWGAVQPTPPYHIPRRLRRLAPEILNTPLNCCRFPNRQTAVNDSPRTSVGGKSADSGRRSNNNKSGGQRTPKPRIIRSSGRTGSRTKSLGHKWPHKARLQLNHRRLQRSWTSTSAGVRIRIITRLAFARRRRLLTNLISVTATKWITSHKFALKTGVRESLYPPCLKLCKWATYSYQILCMEYVVSDQWSVDCIVNEAQWILNDY